VPRRQAALKPTGEVEQSTVDLLVQVLAWNVLAQVADIGRPSDSE
jgi:hypothetical protein